MGHKTKYTTWLLSWDMYGIESIVNVDYYEQAAKEHAEAVVWSALQDKPPPANRREFNNLFQAILMRARINSHRHYEVYAVTMPSNVTEDDIRQMFTSNPQGMAELVREKGTKHFSNRAGTQKVVIQ